jgi:hypothetical protein
VFENLLATARAEYQRIVMTTICGVIIAVCALVAVLFVAIAVFVWISEHYGTVTAALSMAGFFAVVALIAAGVAAYAASVARERARKQAEDEKRERAEAAKNAPPAWLDPALIPTLLPIGIQALRVGLRHRGLLLALIGSVAVGWAALRNRGTPDAAAEAEQQPAE